MDDSPAGLCFRRMAVGEVPGDGEMGLSVRKLAGALGAVAVVCTLAAAQGTGSSAKPATSSSSHPAGSSSTKQTSSKHTSSKKSKKSRKRGQQAIDSTRAREIQQALARENYLQGPPSGKWDEKTQSAMRKYQADQGWQSKTVPDSRALIKLGLGPSKDGLLNPETAMTSASEHPATSAKPAEPAPAGKGEPRN